MIFKLSMPGKIYYNIELATITHSQHAKFKKKKKLKKHHRITVMCEAF